MSRNETGAAIALILGSFVSDCLPATEVGRYFGDLRYFTEDAAAYVGTRDYPDIKLGTLKDLYILELKDLHSAEKQIIKTLAASRAS